MTFLIIQHYKNLVINHNSLGMMTYCLTSLLMLPAQSLMFPFHSHTFLSNLAKTNLVSGYSLAPPDYVPFEIIVVKCPFNSERPHLCNRMSKSTCPMDIRDDLLHVLSVGMGEQRSSEGVVSQSAPQEAWSRGRGVGSVEQQQVRHAGGLQSMTRESLTDMHLVASGSDFGENITTALNPPIPHLVRKVRPYLGVPRQKVGNRVDGR